MRSTGHDLSWAFPPLSELQGVACYIGCDQGGQVSIKCVVNYEKGSRYGQFCVPSEISSMERPFHGIPPYFEKENKKCHYSNIERRVVTWSTVIINYTFT